MLALSLITMIKSIISNNRADLYRARLLISNLKPYKLENHCKLENIKVFFESLNAKKRKFMREIMFLETHERDDRSICD